MKKAMHKPRNTGCNYGPRKKTQWKVPYTTHPAKDCNKNTTANRSGSISTVSIYTCVLNVIFLVQIVVIYNMLQKKRKKPPLRLPVPDSLVHPKCSAHFTNLEFRLKILLEDKVTQNNKSGF